MLIMQKGLILFCLCVVLRSEPGADKSAAWIRPSTRQQTERTGTGTGKGKDRKKDEKNRERAKLKPIALIKNHRLIYCTALHQLGG